MFETMTQTTLSAVIVVLTCTYSQSMSVSVGRYVGSATIPAIVLASTTLVVSHICARDRLTVRYWCARCNNIS